MDLLKIHQFATSKHTNFTNGPRGGVESNRTNIQLIFIEFFELFFKSIFRINQLISFLIE